MKPEARHIPAVSVRNMQRRIALDASRAGNQRGRL
jgi:hypothetical protein